ncbi:MAG: hypothetical protein IT290_05830 [Deltaproteobacteria bacterium]|nr:hypothetical protein [Deltaproteobacteria bacterium]
MKQQHLQENNVTHILVCPDFATNDPVQTPCSLTATRHSDTRTLNEHGLTLLELTASLFLTSLIAASAIFSMHSMTRGRALRAASNELVRLLDVAAFRAASLQQQLDVTASPTSPNEIAVVAHPRGSGFASPHRASIDAERRVVLRMSLPSGVSYRAQFAGPGVGPIYYPSGTTTPGRFELSDGSGSRCNITQSLRGNRRVTCFE